MNQEAAMRAMRYARMAASNANGYVIRGALLPCIGATCGIVSLYDDASWMVCCKPSSMNASRAW